MDLESVIGLEIHVQLKTKSKMFCSCSNDSDNMSPNTCVCPICMGHPGVLPVPNKQAVAYAVKAALAIQCVINEETKFDRKHYFYPDLPKGYQISQFDVPIGENGLVEIETKDGTRSIRIERLHIEEDAAKNIHDKSDVTLIDFNRAGTPLIEIVTHPDFRNPSEAKIFLIELRAIMRTLGVSNADMEKGNLRCDANISMRPIGDKKLYPKTEIKNLNSFKAVERALLYEIERQADLWKTNTYPNINTTRGWNEAKQATIEQRTKEESQDYRYFPEPDIPPLLIKDVIEREKNELPELPQAKRNRFIYEYKFGDDIARILVDNRELSDFTEAVMSEAINWLVNVPELEGTREEIINNNLAKLSKQIGSWLTSRLLGALSLKNLDVSTMKMNAENFAELMTMIFRKQINSTIANKLLEFMIDTEQDPSNILEERGLNIMSQENNLDNIVLSVINSNPEQVQKYLSGKTQVIQYLVGIVMRETKGAADPEQILAMLEKHIKEN